ncbi:MAG TPA: ATP-binding protein [Steroidobacteraceae bacterium]|nr:ATP-binding protein [Steroidobacteraceae bacterium]
MHAVTPPPPVWPLQLSLLLGAYALLGGLTSLSGWAFDLPDLAAWFDYGITIQPNGALCSALTGLCVCLLAFGWRGLAAAVGSVVWLTGSLTLLQWIFGIDFGIDAPLTFGREWGRVAAVYPGRMGLPASTSFTLLGVALVATAIGPRRWRRRAPRVAMVTFGIGVLSITGQLYGADLLHTVPRVTAISMQTATFILAASAGVIALQPSTRPMRWLVSQTAVGVIARRAVPVVVLAPIAIGWLRLEGERLGFYDTAFGTALLVLILIALLGLVLWRGLDAIARHEAALYSAEQRVQLAITAGDAATWDLDLVTGGSVRSDSYYTLLGYDPATAAQATDLHWTSSILPEDLPAVLAEWQRARVDRNLFRMEYRTRRADDSTMWVRSAGRFLYDESGDPVRFVGVYVDISDERHAIEQLRVADRRKDEFLAMLAHELRNPLAPLRNAATLLKAKGPPTPELQWAREVIDRQVQQMTRLIDDLLDTSRIRSGKIELRRGRIELVDVVNGAVEASRPLIDQSGHELAVELPPASVPLQGDLVRLSQVFCNLLNNAARYTPRGGHIQLRAVCIGTQVEVCVRDDGIGIPAGMLPRVFEMFTQVDRSLERTRGGLGLGLTLVKQLVELHGGEVEARSAGAGRGSEFVVRLPLAAETAAPCVRAPDTAATPVSRAGVPARVLVVDDNEDAASSLAALLRVVGHEVWTAHDGLDGLRVARERRPDVVLLDLGMPKLNGFEVATAIRREPWGREVLLVALTGWGQARDRERSRSAGFDEHLVKPVALEQLQPLFERVRARETVSSPA